MPSAPARPQVSPLSRVGKLSRERVPELAQGLPAGLETGGTLILAYSPGRVVGYLQGIFGPMENRPGPKGKLQPQGPPAQSYQQFLGSKWQGEEGWDPRVCCTCRLWTPKMFLPLTVFWPKEKWAPLCQEPMPRAQTSGAFCPSTCWL